MSQKPSFDYVSMLVMMEESAPTEEALRRWQALYPDYHLSLQEFFEIWRMEEEMAAEAPEDEEAIEKAVEERTSKAVAWAMETLRKQGRVIPDDYIAQIGRFEQFVLAAVDELDGRGNAVDILEKVSEATGKDVLLASVLKALDGLKNKYCLEWRYADPVTEPENEGIRYFMITIAGERSLAHAVAASRASDLLGDNI